MQIICWRNPQKCPRQCYFISVPVQGLWSENGAVIWDVAVVDSIKDGRWEFHGAGKMDAEVSPSKSKVHTTVQFTRIKLS